jgi:hypothetical protein
MNFRLGISAGCDTKWEASHGKKFYLGKPFSNRREKLLFWVYYNIINYIVIKFIIL